MPVRVQGAVGYAVLGTSALDALRSQILSILVTRCAAQLLVTIHDSCFDMAYSVTFGFIVHPCLLSASSDENYERGIVVISCVALTFSLFDLQLLCLDAVHVIQQLKRHSLVFLAHRRAERVLVINPSRSLSEMCYIKACRLFALCFSSVVSASRPEYICCSDY